jgi:hypothetical protein
MATVVARLLSSAALAEHLPVPLRRAAVAHQAISRGRSGDSRYLDAFARILSES